MKSFSSIHSPIARCGWPGRPRTWARCKSISHDDESNCLGGLAGIIHPPEGQVQIVHTSTSYLNACQKVGRSASGAGVLGGEKQGSCWPEMISLAPIAPITAKDR